MINPKLHRYVGKLNTDQDYLIREFVDNYEDGVMSRRDLLERVFQITGSVAAAAGTLLALGVKPAFADPLAAANPAPRIQTPPRSPLSVPDGDPAVIGSDVTFRGADGATIMAYMARPAAAGRYPGVLICHENRGTSEHFRDVTRRFAKNGYVGLHIDLLSRQGGTAAVNPNDIGGIISGPGAADRHVSDFQQGMAYLRQQPFVIADRIGMTGYCFGGGVTWNMTVKEPTLRAAAPYYGVPAPMNEDAAKIRAAVLAVYGQLDERVTAMGVALEPALQAARVTYKLNVYPNANHAFFNDTGGSYNEAASLAAWRDTLAWFATYLRGTGLPATGDGSVEEEAGGEEEVEQE